MLSLFSKISKKCISKFKRAYIGDIRTSSHKKEEIYMKNYLASLERLGEEEVLLPLLDKISDKLVLAAAIIGGPFFIYLLFQFSILFF
jgi:hypothetical protein